MRYLAAFLLLSSICLVAQDPGDYNYYEHNRDQLPPSVARVCFPDVANSHAEAFYTVDTHPKKADISIRIYLHGRPGISEWPYKNLHVGDHPTKFAAVEKVKGEKGLEKSIFAVDWGLKTFTPRSASAAKAGVFGGPIRHA